MELDSPTITLLSPSGSPLPYYAEFGWTAPADTNASLPNSESEWIVDGNDVLTPTSSVSLRWDNGEGMIFHRTFTVDDDYLFTVIDEVENATSQTVTLHPYALVSRHGLPEVLGYYVLHEGLIGVLSNDGLLEIDYDDLEGDTRIKTYQSDGGWLGFTDKYWAVALIPDQTTGIAARFSDNPRNGRNVYQTDYLANIGIEVPAGGIARTESNLFAGAKVVSIVDGYQEDLGVETSNC